MKKINAYHFKLTLILDNFFYDEIDFNFIANEIKENDWIVLCLDLHHSNINKQEKLNLKNKIQKTLYKLTKSEIPNILDIYFLGDF